MNLTTYAGHVADRCQFGANDPELDKLAGYIGQAINSYQAANRRGWDWLRRDVTLTATTDQQTYPFADLAALVADNDPTVLYPVRRVYTVSLLTVSGQSQALERVSRYDAEETWGTVTTSELPHVWTAEARTLYLYPRPQSALDFGLRVLLTDSVDVADETSSPLLPDEYSEMIVELACSYAFRGIRDRARAADALAAYQAERNAALTDLPYGGPGRPSLEPR